MSGGVTFSQTNVAASVSIVPGAGVTLSGAVPGRGYVSATIGADGHLRLAATDGTVEDLGRVGTTTARVAPSGSTQADATPITATTSILLPGAAGGGVVMTDAGTYRIVNRAGVDVPLYPNPGGAIEQQAINVPVAIGAGETAVLASPDALIWNVS